MRNKIDQSINVSRLSIYFLLWLANMGHTGIKNTFYYLVKYIRNGTIDNLIQGTKGSN